MPSKFADLTCPNPKCNGDVNKPLLLTDRSKTPAETYYACPRCMTKLDSVSKMQDVQDLVPPTAQKLPEEDKSPEVLEQKKTEGKPAKPLEPKEETPPECSHYLGYLSRRPPSTPIPEECLTCRKMMKCVLKL